MRFPLESEGTENGLAGFALFFFDLVKAPLPRHSFGSNVSANSTKLCRTKVGAADRQLTIRFGCPVLLSCPLLIVTRSGSIPLGRMFWAVSKCERSVPNAHSNRGLMTSPAPGMPLNTAAVGMASE